MYILLTRYLCFPYTARSSSAVVCLAPRRKVISAPSKYQSSFSNMYRITRTHTTFNILLTRYLYFAYTTRTFSAATCLAPRRKVISAPSNHQSSFSNITRKQTTFNMYDHTLPLQIAPTTHMSPLIHVHLLTLFECVWQRAWLRQVISVPVLFQSHVTCSCAHDLLIFLH